MGLNLAFFCFLIIALNEVGGGCIEGNYSSLDLTTPKRRLIIDTDAGSDDGVAILNFLGAEKLFHQLQVELITAVSGNTHVDNVGRNLLKILKTVNRLDIPVYKGSNESILITPESEHYFGKDGFGDFDFPDPPSEDLIQKGHAVNALITAAALSPGNLTLVCLGPLTNIALAIRLDPNFLTNLREVFILGGSDSGVGNMKPGVEFNFYVDPDAAHIVFEEAKKKKKILNLVTWETAFLRSSIDTKWRTDVLGVVESPQISLLNKAERLTFQEKKWTSSDAVLSSVVIDSKIIEDWGTYHGAVEVCGELSRGTFFVDYDCCGDMEKNVRIVKKINIDLHKKMLLRHLGEQTTAPCTPLN